MQKQQRLTKELARIARTPPTGINLSAKDDKLDILEANILGPEESPYQDGLFKLELMIPQNYPFAPPSIKFLTKIYHPNIDDHGRICLDLLKMPPKGNWRPTIGVEGLLIAVRMLMKTPNPDDPLMVEIADEFKNNLEEYNRKAKMFTKQHAIIELEC